MNKVERVTRAGELFCSGYNCGQATVAAFADMLGIDEDAALRLGSSFGGGIARNREVCGAVNGAALVLGAVFGYDKPEHDEAAAHYAYVNRFVEAFRARHGSIVCRELLEIKEKEPYSPIPTERTAAFYAQRPCARFVCDAVATVCDLLVEESERRGASALHEGWNRSEQIPATMELPIHYQLYLPKNYDPSRTYPVLLYMHGNGTRGSDNMTHITAPTASIVRTITGDPKYNGDVILFAPQCLRTEQWVNRDKTMASRTLEKDPQPCLVAALEAFRYWMDRLPVDRKRVMLWGNSCGAFASFDLLARFPGQFAGAVAVAGFGAIDTADRLLGARIHAHHGDIDEVVSYKGDEELINAIKEKNPTADVSLTCYPGRRHTIFAEVGENRDEVDWLLTLTATEGI